MGTGMAGILQNVQEICGNGYSCCGNTAGMEFIAAGIPQGVFGKRANVQLFSLYFLTA